MPLRYPFADHSATTGFGLNLLDRMSERREDAAFIAGLRAEPAARTLLFVLPDIVIAGDGPLFARAAAEAAGADWDGALYLGTADRPLFATPIAAAPEGAEVHNLRALAISGLLPDELLGPIAQARSVLGWHATHRFCANCGTATTPAGAGMRRDCPSCDVHHFPRTDPVVIMLAVDGERCLLGRQKRFAPGLYSCLAGFVEPGETLEAAVRRELFEEAGVRTGSVGYHASQPWPFPSNLMIGCFAEATSFEVAPRDGELEDVRWFDRAAVAKMLGGTHPANAAPPAVAIANNLLTAYVAHGAPVAQVASSVEATRLSAGT